MFNFKLYQKLAELEILELYDGWLNDKASTCYPFFLPPYLVLSIKSSRSIGTEAPDISI